ncbi:MAG: cell division protein FtsA [Leptospirales bacterium]|nr:cell division protein FtsA [Leptospirales bacterium]
MKGNNIAEDIVVALDVGTTKTCVVIGRSDENNMIEIVGVGSAPSTGLTNGIILNIDDTAASIRKAVEEAEFMSGYQVGSVYVGLSGQHIKGQASKGVIAVTNRNRTITSAEVRRVVDAAQAVVIPMDREILHVLSREFSVDDQKGIRDPIGMSGVRLEADVHIITGATASIQNMIKAVEKSGFRYLGMVFSPLASSDAIISLDEKDLGVALVDIGGGTTDIIVYSEGGVAYSSVLPVGGLHVTKDISAGLMTSLESAEIMKRAHGCAVIELVDPSDMVDVPSVGGRAPRKLYRQELAHIIEARMTEIMEMIDQELIKSGKKEFLNAGIVLVGGACMMPGSLEAAEKVFNIHVKIGEPVDVSGLKDIVATPQFAHSVGLLKYGNKINQLRAKNFYGKKKPSVFSKIKKLFDDYM